MKKVDNEIVIVRLENPVEHDRHMLVLLHAEIKRLNHLYYNAEPELSDEEYDMRYRYMERLEARFPDLVDKNSPTQTVGAKV